MRTYGIIQFEEHEREKILRALEGLESLIEEEKRGETYHPIRKFLHMLHHEESFDARVLSELTTALTACITKLAPETQESWWREQAGAETAALSPDGLAGLAETRQQQVKLLQEARDLVWEARDLAGEAPPTKSERKAEFV